jgi:hypothetical protein
MLADPKCKNATSQGKAIRKLADMHPLPLSLIVGQWQVVELLGMPEVLRFPAGIGHGASHIQSTALPK